MSEGSGPPSRPKGEGNYSRGVFKPGSQPLSSTGPHCKWCYYGYTDCAKIIREKNSIK